MKSSKISLKAKILCGVLAGGVILSSGSSAFAAGENTSDSTQNSKIECKIPMDRSKFHEERMTEMNTILQDVLKEAVASKTITQKESDQIKAYTDKKAEEAKKFREQRKAGEGKAGNKELKGRTMGKEGKGELFAELVTEGILTQEKANTLREKIHVKTEALREANLKQNLSKLVENKTLTQDQADKIAAAIKAENNARKADFEEIKNMTEEERREYMKGKKNSYKDPLKVLVENGTITEAQEQEVRKVVPTHKGKHGRPRVKGATTSNETVNKNAVE